MCLDPNSVLLNLLCVLDPKNCVHLDLLCFWILINSVLLNALLCVLSYPVSVISASPYGMSGNV